MSLVVTALLTVREARQVSRRQSRRVAERSNLSAAEFEERLGAAGISSEVARKLHAALLPYCGGGLRPHPDDDLASSYALDPDEAEYLIEGLWDALGLPKPTVRSPERIPGLGTVQDLAHYLQEACDRLREPPYAKAAGNPAARMYSSGSGA